jgi:hypothetical protein
MTAKSITLAEAGRTSATAFPVSPATGRIIPAVTVTAAVVPAVLALPVPAPVAIPVSRATSAAAYFGLFRSCNCGHSSAWHNGAFGDAWRAGVQVRGGCEAAVEDGSTSGCGCARFREADVAS